MGVPNLSDGTPLTYEWLNQVADAINKLDVNSSDYSNVKFDGNVNGSKDDILILTGTEEITISAANAGENVIRINNIKFKVAFASNNVTVVAMVTSNQALQNDNPVAAGVAVGQITSNNFDAVIQLFADKAKFGKKKLQLKYVAIGPKQS
jgi:hypothetical protein